MNQGIFMKDVLNQFHQKRILLFKVGGRDLKAGLTNGREPIQDHDHSLSLDLDQGLVQVGDDQKIKETTEDPTAIIDIIIAQGVREEDICDITDNNLLELKFPKDSYHTIFALTYGEHTFKEIE